ncbi:hypothetical protein Tco_0977852 [Tanacetum coccineum]|uniref:Uncharacterized protein n=1 Tax=Tanacetum coccineum TaxID=301880 RepID=A0ABQ5ELC9_9ASTR
MFEVSIILEDDSAELMSRGANGLVNVSLSNTVTSSFVSTFVELIGYDDYGLGKHWKNDEDYCLDLAWIQGSSEEGKHWKNDEDYCLDLAWIQGSSEEESDPRALAYLRLSLGHGTTTGITMVVRICPGGTTMADVSLEEEGGTI